MTIGVIELADTREAWRIVYCPRCEVDTMPSDRTGRCFFCETQLIEPVPFATVDPGARYCELCDTDISDAVPLARYCSTRCRKKAWDTTDKGLALRDKKVKKQADERRAARHAVKAAAPKPLPVPPLRLPGRCAMCDQWLPKHKSKFCSDAHKQAYWIRYSEKGRAWMLRQAAKQKAVA